MYLLNFYKYMSSIITFFINPQQAFSQMGIQMCCGWPLIKKIVLVFMCCLTNCSFEQALMHTVDSHFSNPVYKPGPQYVKRARLLLQMSD